MRSSWVPKRKINKIRKIFVSADKRTREDFEHSRVVNERDYQSRFLTLVNYPTQTRGKRCEGLFMAQCTTDRVERNNGVDAVLVFKYDNQYKIAFFECKIEKKDFDNGRFVKQLEKQRMLRHHHKGVICFEMFFHKWAITPFEDELSSICTLDQVDEFIKATSRETMIKWGHGDLVALFEWLKTKMPGRYSIGNLIDAILNCTLGQLYTHPYSNAEIDSSEFVKDTILTAEGLQGKEGDNMPLNQYREKYQIESVGFVNLD